MDKQTKPPKFSAEVRERAIRMVLERRGEHAPEWAAIVSTASSLVIQRRAKRATFARRRVGNSDVVLSNSER